MFYAEFERLVLGLIHQDTIAGEDVSPAYNNQQDYLGRIPGLLNAALSELSLAAPRRGTRELSDGESVGFGLWHAYRLPEDCREILSGGVRRMTGGGAVPFDGYRFMGDRLAVPDGAGGRFLVEYFRKAEQVPIPVPEGYEFTTEAEYLFCAAYFVAAGLVMMEDEFSYSVLTGEYEKRKAELRQGPGVEVQVIPDGFGFGFGCGPGPGPGPGEPFPVPAPPKGGGLSWDGLSIGVTMSESGEARVSKDVEGENCSFTLTIPQGGGGGGGDLVPFTDAEIAYYVSTYFVMQQ